MEQYLARIGYPSGLKQQQIPEPDPNLDIRLATIEDVQANILNPLEAQYETQQQALAAFSSWPAAQTRRLDLREEASSPPNLPDRPPTTSTPETEADHQLLEPKHEQHHPPPPSTKAAILSSLHSELDRRQQIFLGIERQIEACRTDLRTHPSKKKKKKKKKTETEHAKRIAEFMAPVQHDATQDPVEAPERKDAQTAEEAEVEEMRGIYLQYDRGSIGVPAAESVDAFFALVADAEHDLKEADEAQKIVARREGKLEERLYKARCAVLETEEEIEEVGCGAVPMEGREPEVEEKSRAEGCKEGKGKPRRRKGVGGGQSRKGNGGDERVGRGRKRRQNISGTAGKMSLDS